MIIAFDLTNQESFEGVKTWMNSIYKHSDPSIAKVLVGNKLDLEADRIVSKSDAQKIANEHGMEYFETSAKNNININEVMTHIMDKVYDNLYGNGAASLGEDLDHGKQSLVLKRGSNANNKEKEGGGGGSVD
jgi:GTPase SAR1 family protein